MDGDELREVARIWLEDKLSILDVAADRLAPAKCKILLKDELATWLSDSMTYVSKQNDMLSDLLKENRDLKSSLIKSQQSVIELQDELLTNKKDQLQSLQATVKTSVESSVKAGLDSYSTVVAKSQSQSIATDALKSAVKIAINEDDRSRSLMVFGLPEGTNEDLCAKVDDILQQIGEKPKIEAARLGKENTDGKIRPVKVTLRSSAAVGQILIKAKQLKNSAKYRSVYISPDRTPEQRLQHKKLVVEMKAKFKDLPGQRHYIRGGTVCSIDIATA